MGWLNEVLERLWLLCLKPLVSTKLINDCLRRLGEQLEDEEPLAAGLLRQLRVERLSLGDSPIIITRMHTDTESRHQLGLEVGLAYRGTTELVVHCNSPNLVAVGRNLTLELEARLVVGPLPRDLNPPDGVSLSLLSPPLVHLEGGGVLAVPILLTSRLLHLLCSPLLPWLVLQPRSLVLHPFLSTSSPWPRLGSPAGLLRVVVVEARRMVASDQSLLQTVSCGRMGEGYSDPYCQVTLGSHSTSTPIIKKTCNPVWGFYCEFPVAAPGPWNTPVELVLQMLDWDRGLEPDDDLGQTSVDLACLNPRGEVLEASLSLATVRAISGEVLVRLQWVPCLPLHRSLPSSSSSEPCSQAILMVHLRSVATNTMIEPVLSLQFSGGDFQTTAKGSFSSSTDFEEEFMLLVPDPTTDTLRVALYDLSSSANWGAQQLLQGGLGLVKGNGKPSILNPEREAHKASMGEQGLEKGHLVGELLLKVSPLLHGREVEVEKLLLTSIEVEARVRLCLRLHRLERPGEDILSVDK